MCFPSFFICLSLHPTFHAPFPFSLITFLPSSLTFLTLISLLPYFLLLTVSSSLALSPFPLLPHPPLILSLSLSLPSLPLFPLHSIPPSIYLYLFLPLPLSPSPTLPLPLSPSLPSPPLPLSPSLPLCLSPSLPLSLSPSLPLSLSPSLPLSLSPSLPLSLSPSLPLSLSPYLPLSLSPLSLPVSSLSPRLSLSPSRSLSPSLRLFFSPISLSFSSTLSLSLSIYLSIYLHIYLSIYLSLHHPSCVCACMVSSHHDYICNFSTFLMREDISGNHLRYFDLHSPSESNNSRHSAAHNREEILFYRCVYKRSR